MRKQANLFDAVKTVYQAFVEFTKILQKLSQLAEKLKSAKDDPQLIQEIVVLVKEILDIKAWDGITKIYEAVKQKLSKKSSQQKSLLKLANSLDQAGLHKEAAEVDLIVKEGALPILAIIKGLYSLYTFYKMYRGMRGELQQFLSKLAKMNKDDFKTQKDYVLSIIGLFVKTFAKAGLREFVMGQFPDVMVVLEKLESKH